MLQQRDGAIGHGAIGGCVDDCDSRANESVLIAFSDGQACIWANVGEGLSLSVGPEYGKVVDGFCLAKSEKQLFLV